MTALVLAGVSHHYGTTDALSDIELRVAAGERIAMVGPSGCGKTTLLEIACGLITPTAGTVTAEPATLMPQRDVLLPWLSALDNAALPLRIAGAGRGEARARALPLLQRFGLGGFEHAQPSALSGGMRQRVSFIRALLTGKPLLALDEPFGALDAMTRSELQSWLDEALTSEPRTVMLVTHDVEEAVLLADRVLVLSPRPGHIVADLTVGLAHPRVPTDPAVQAIRARALAVLGAPR